MKQQAKQQIAIGLLAVAGVIIPANLRAQNPAPAQTTAPPAPTGAPARPAGAPSAPAFRSSYPTRPAADPAALARGRALYGINCNFCHGSDVRGGEGGPNLLRSPLVLNDKNGELIAPVVINGRPDQGMPKFPMTMAQISDIATYIHDFKVGGYDISRMTPPSILVGEAKAGEAYFRATCGSCHSVTGDLKGIATRIPDPKTLQNNWLMPGGGFRPARQRFVKVPPTTVTVTLASGEKVQGVLGRIDDFTVTLKTADGNERTFRRDEDTPRVEIHDPLQPHKDLLPTYSDKDIHNLTSYLVTLK